MANLMSAPFARRRTAVVRAVGAASLLGCLVLGESVAGAQQPPLFPPTTTTAPGAGTASTTPSTLPVIDIAGLLKPPPPTTVAPAPPPPPAAEEAPLVPDDGGGEGSVPPASAGEFPADLAAKSRSVRRSRANNSRALVTALQPLIDMGLPAEEALRVGMGRFPVAGAANYSHDWWLPRFGPGWRLHLGTDLFAPTGTPVRSPADGSLRLASGGLGGISAYVVQSDGTYYYFAHLDGYVEGMANGRAVAAGEVFGFVGTSGNATGGSPHLHFEYHPAPTRTITKGRGKSRTVQFVTIPVRPGTTLPAVDPKVWLDQALAEAQAAAPALIAQYEADPSLLPAQPVVAIPNPAALLDPAGAGQLASATAGLVTPRPLATVPLTALAALLVVVMASLIPVLAPRRSGPAAAPASSAGPLRPGRAQARDAGGGDQRSKRRRGRRGASSRPEPPGPAGSTGPDDGRLGRRPPVPVAAG